MNPRDVPVPADMAERVTAALQAAIEAQASIPRPGDGARLSAVLAEWTDLMNRFQGEQCTSEKKL